MEQLGKIYQKINDESGYIIDTDGKEYLFFLTDILDNTKIIEGTVVLFKPTQDKVPRATYISKA